jgi:hypothetical protein
MNVVGVLTLTCLYLYMTLYRKTVIGPKKEFPNRNEKYNGSYP